MSVLGDRLRQLREEKGLLQRELAESLNLSRVAITQYEQGRRVPEVDILVKLADFFMVSVDYLLGRTDIRIMYAATYQPETSAHSNKQSTDILPDKARQCLKDFEEFIHQKYANPKSSQ